MSRIPRRPWTHDELNTLKCLYPEIRTDELAKLLDRPVSRVYARANNLGLKKSEAYYALNVSGRIDKGNAAKRGEGTRFGKGNLPWNKGATGWIAPGRSAETRFAPGVVPPNTRDLGETRISKEGLLYRKFSTASHGSPSRRWRSVHRLVWEAANGPCPDGYRVCFKPGCSTNVEAEITLDKLELLSFGDVMKRNSMHNNPELAKLHQLKGAINRQVRRITNEAKEQGIRT